MIIILSLLRCIFEQLKNIAEAYHAHVDMYK